MQPPPTDSSPLLSVVVPIYNVSDYLTPCLESIAAQTYPFLEVILVDDGSTDSSGRMADEFAAGRDGWTVLHVENGGLGRARNLGMDAAHGQYIAFVDSDDLVLRDAYEMMMASILASGSDIVSGGVQRFDGERAFPSPLHDRAITQTQVRTHIRRSPSLLYDTTAWNKIFRREFLLEHGLRFPEGVLYEDIPLTLPAHFLATSVDMLLEPVYLWRERQTATQSITQRRAEARNLVDRMAAISSVNAFLERTGEAEGKALHDAKVLSGDMPLYLSVIHQGDREYVDTLVSVFSAYLADVDAATFATLPARHRLSYHLISAGRTEDLVEAHADPVKLNRPKVVRRGVRLYAKLPFFEDESRGVPLSVYDVTRTQTLRTGVRDVRWNGSTLLIDGHAYIDGVPDVGPGSSVRRLQLRIIGAADDRRRRVRARRARRQDVTAKSVHRPVNYDGCGFVARVGAADVALPDSADHAEFEVIAQVAAPSARRGSRVGNPEYSRALHPPRGWVDDGLLLVPGYRARKLILAASRVDAVVRDLSVDPASDVATVVLAAAPGAPAPDGWLHLRRAADTSGVTVRCDPQDGRRAVAVVPLPELGVREQSVMERSWSMYYLQARPGDDPSIVDGVVDQYELETTAGPRRLSVDGRRVYPLHLEPEASGGRAVAHGRQLHLRQDGLRGAALVDGQCRPELVDFRFGSRGLELRGDLGGADVDHLVLEHDVGSVRVPLVLDGSAWSALIPHDGRPGEPCLRWLGAGSTEVAAESAASAGAVHRVRVEVGPLAEARLDESSDGPVSVVLRSDPQHLLQLLADGGGRWSDRGAFHNRNNRRIAYPLMRRLPLTDSVFFEAWKGRQFSDNPRAIHEELVRRGDERPRIWAVQDNTVEVPEGVETVITGSRAYFHQLARARWVVSNDSMPKHYVKRDGSRYGQTWHGTPLKRIGFDMQNLKMGNKNYLTEFAVEVGKWDALVSPNAFSTEVLARAFRYDGPVLEIGYPRNDVFYRPADRALREAAVRRRLGIDPDKRVILYAPTWRDSDFDAQGRYLFRMYLDLEDLHRRFGDDSVVLVRGHQLVSRSVGTSGFGDFVHNVSLYPDIGDLYLAADVLVTDYSSVMFDFVNTGRPMIFFCHDLEQYRDELRGFYFDFEQVAPGPIVQTPGEVAEALGDLDGVADRYRERYESFRTRYAALEDGFAASRFVDAFLTDGE